MRMVRRQKTGVYILKGNFRLRMRPPAPETGPATMRKIIAALVSSLALIVCTEGHAVQKGKEKPKDDARGTVATEEEVMQKLKELTGATKFAALGWFGKALPPNEEVKAVVARKLIVMLTEDDNVVVNGGAARALVNWATEEVAPKLMVVAVGAGNSAYAVTALGNLKYEKAIPLMIRRLEALKDRVGTGKALAKMGPVAEPAVIEVLANKRPEAVTEACRVLGQIGTKASLPPLEALTKGKNKALAFAAENAIAAINEREKSIEKKK
jgi:HEAT repeat protein